MLEAKRRAAIFLILAFILAAVAGYLILQKVEQLNSELGGMQEIYIANTDIQSRTLINSSQWTTMEIPRKFVMDKSHVLNEEDLKNKVSIVPLAKGDIITQEMLKEYTVFANEDNRMVAIPASEKVRFDQGLQPMDRIDIVVSVEENGEKLTKTFMTDVLVTYAQYSDQNPNILTGIGVEVNQEKAPDIIHMQNYAEFIRILKANVGMDHPLETPAKAEQPPKETKPAEKPAEKPAAGNPPATPPATPPAGNTGNAPNSGTNANNQGSGGQ